MPRLLNVHTLQMHEFFDEDVPDYAILSHTWGGDEITFQDWHNLLEFQELQKVLAVEEPESDLHFAPNSYSGQQRRQVNTIKAKAGYQKVLDFCKIVETYHTDRSIDPIEWAWVDTCCIDKTSSAELSEAINSMYRWYRRSKVCMVYLSDVSARSFNEQEIFEQEFLKSRWLSRAWTLQELLAPSQIDFFDAGWNYVGDDQGLEGLLERATGISSEHFGFREVGNEPEVSISTRMSWAAKRTTTRAEDMAYCLLGIFGVSMPLLYGEGGPRAFARLQEEIMKQSTDHTIFAWGYGMALVGEKSDEAGCRWAASIRETSSDSLFAPSPAYFVNGHLIKRLSPRQELPFQMTNRGLQISLPLRKVEDIPGTYIALLNCTPISPPSCLHQPAVGIYLNTTLSKNGKIKDGDVFWKASTSKPTTVDLRDSPLNTTITVIIQRASESVKKNIGPLRTFVMDIKDLITLQPSGPWKLQQVLSQLQTLTLRNLGTSEPDFRQLCLQVGLDPHTYSHRATGKRASGERGTMVFLASFTGRIRFVFRVEADYSNRYDRDGGQQQNNFWNWRVYHKPFDSPGYRCSWKSIPMKACKCLLKSVTWSDDSDKLRGLPYRAILHPPEVCSVRGTGSTVHTISILVSESAARDEATGQEYNAELLDTQHDVALLQGDEKLYRPQDFDDVNTL